MTARPSASYAFNQIRETSAFGFSCSKNFHSWLFPISHFLDTSNVSGPFYKHLKSYSFWTFSCSVV